MSRSFSKKPSSPSESAPTDATSTGHLAAAGTARPSSPGSVFAEDFSLLIKTPRRLRVARSRIDVLS